MGIKMFSKLLCWFCLLKVSAFILRVTWITVCTSVPAWALSWAWGYHGPSLPCATVPPEVSRFMGILGDRLSRAGGAV